MKKVKRMTNLFLRRLFFKMSYSIGENCIGCTACARSCPVEAISGERGQRHSVNAKRCVDCGVCGRTCPKGAVTDEAGRAVAAVPRAKWQKPVIDKTLCSACSMCVAVCRANALRIAPPAFHGDIHVTAELFDGKKCVGCALCARECPLHAIAMREVEA